MVGQDWVIVSGMKYLLLILTCLTFSVSNYAQKPTPTPAPEPFLLSVEDAFHIAGRGVVATGRIERGTIKTGDAVEVVGIKATKTVTVAEIEMSRKVLSEAKAGDTVGLILSGTEKGDVERGQVIAKPGSIKATTKVKATIDLLGSHERGRSTPINDKYRGLFYIRLVGFSGVVTLPPGTTPIAPGTKGAMVEIVFEKPVAIEKGHIFGISESGRAIGTGKITTLVQ